MTAPHHARTVVIIPARFHSQRLPAKPLLRIAGKTMIEHVYERASGAARADEVVVATDDERIAEAVRAFGGEVIMTPTSLPSGTDRVAYAARSISDAQIVVNVQGDEPLLPPDMIDEAVGLLARDPRVDVGTLVRRIETLEELVNPSVVKVVLDAESHCLYFSRSAIPFTRDKPMEFWLQQHPYYKHIGLYVYRHGFLRQYEALRQTALEQAEKLEQLRILEYGYRIKARETRHDSFPVDTDEDLQRVRSMFGEHVNERTR